MKRTLVFLLLIGAFCALVGEFIFAVMPRQMEEIELPDIHIRGEK